MANWLHGYPKMLHLQVYCDNRWVWLINVIHTTGQNVCSLLNDITSFRDGNILVTQIQRMGTLLDLVNLTKNSDKYV